MGEQRNLTDINVEELKAHLERMQKGNPDLEYKFFKQTKQKYCKDCDEWWAPRVIFCGLCGKKL